MNKFSSFLCNFFFTALRFVWIIVISVILIIVGAIWSDICLYIGIFLIVVSLISALIGAIRMQRIMNYRTDNDPEFKKIMDELSSDPDGLFSRIMETQEKNKQLHGENLLTLSDEDLFETVCFQNIDIAEDATDEDKELEQFSGARRTVYILNLFDSEIQNGGLCQFFVNSSRAVAPFVGEALKSVGADEHLKLFEGFITENNIDVCNLNSFNALNIRAYKKQTKRFNYDSFDDKYYELPELQEKIVTFIKNNITEF